MGGWGRAGRRNQPTWLRKAYCTMRNTPGLHCRGPVLFQAAHSTPRLVLAAPRLALAAPWKTLATTHLVLFILRIALATP